jgi:hypothetical protein
MARQRARARRCVGTAGTKLPWRSVSEAPISTIARSRSTATYVHRSPEVRALALRQKLRPGVLPSLACRRPSVPSLSPPPHDLTLVR